MKKQILTFIIGALVGAIITTGVFFIIKGNSKDTNQGQVNGQMREFKGERPDMQDGEMPELPDGENADGNTDGNFKGRPNGGQKGNRNGENQDNLKGPDANSQSSNT